MAVEGCQCAAGDIGTRWACWLCHDPGAAGSRVVACFGLDAALAYGNAGEHLCIAILPFDFHRSLELSSQKAIKETDMFAKLYNYLQDVRDRQRINIALSKGAAMMHALGPRAMEERGVRNLLFAVNTKSVSSVLWRSCCMQSADCTQVLALCCCSV